MRIKCANPFAVTGFRQATRRDRSPARVLPSRRRCRPHAHRAAASATHTINRLLPLLPARCVVEVAVLDSAPTERSGAAGGCGAAESTGCRPVPSLPPLMVASPARGTCSLNPVTPTSSRLGRDVFGSAAAGRGVAGAVACRASGWGVGPRWPRSVTVSRTITGCSFRAPQPVSRKAAISNAQGERTLTLAATAT
jgi:hypothetical protein